MTCWPSLTKEIASFALTAAGCAAAPSEIRVEARDNRWAVFLPGDRIAWFPADAEGVRGLDMERRVLRLIAARCSFAVPRIIGESPAGFDVRTMVQGTVDPPVLYHRTLTERPLARQVGTAIGTILAEQHTSIDDRDVAGWLRTRVPWPPAEEWCRERLPLVSRDSALVERAERALSLHRSVAVSPDDFVLAHTDLGLHNIAVDPLTDSVVGVFDYDSAAWADRHHDFRYLVLGERDDTMLEAALEAYEPVVGRRIDRHRVRLYNAACAIGFLAHRFGMPQDEKSCGRTLAEDLSWTTSALAAIAP